MRTLALVTCLLYAGCGSAPSGAPETGTPAGMFAVTPVPARAARAEAAPAAALRIARGQFFSYALPEGWRLGEDGQFALSMGSPDGKAFTAMVAIRACRQAIRPTASSTKNS